MTQAGRRVLFLSQKRGERCSMSEQRSAGKRDRELRPGTQDEMSTPALLVGLIQGKDEAAFEALFRRFYPAVHRVLYSMVGDEAQDLAQEVFLRLYVRPPRDSETNLGAWLYRVASRLGYNALRARRRWRSHRDALGAETRGAGWVNGPADPQAQAEQREAQHTVRRALARLKQRQTTILVLRYNGLSYREIAEALEVSTASVGTMLARAERAFEKVYRGVPECDERIGGGA